MKALISKTKNGIYRRGKSWYLLVKIDGKQIRRSFGSNRDAAVAALNAIYSQRAAAKVTSDWSGLDALFKPKQTMLFVEAAEQYLLERTDLKPNSLRSYKDILKNYLLPHFGKTKIADITEASIARFQASLTETLSAVRVNHVVGFLRYVLKVCVRRKLISENPSTNVKTVKESPPTIDPFDDVELNKILLSAAPTYRALFTTQAWTGMRPNELFGLKWDDVRFDEGVILVKRGRVRGHEGNPKTNQSTRTVPMLSIVKETLRNHRAASVEHLSGHVFLSKQGQPINKHLDREWKAACKRAGIRHRESYQLRHTYASLCLQQGCTPGWVADALGHANMQTTFRYYARFIKSAASENVRLMEKFLESNGHGDQMGDQPSSEVKKKMPQKLT